MKFAPITYFNRNILPYIIAYTAKWTARIILWTCKKEVHGIDTFVKTAKTNPCILMLWHNNMIIAPEILYWNAPSLIYSAFISNSRDGKPLALLAESYRQGRAQRVPHNQRHAALHTMIQRLRDHKEVAIITPDGPRGPKHVLKPGVALAAKASGAHVVPFTWTASSHWELPTWDAMKVPKPFSHVIVHLGEPFLIDQHDSEETAIAKLKSSLNRP